MGNVLSVAGAWGRLTGPHNSWVSVKGGGRREERQGCLAGGRGEPGKNRDPAAVATRESLSTRHPYPCDPCDPCDTAPGCPPGHPIRD